MHASVDLQPIVGALAALVIALTPVLVMRLSYQVKEVHTMVNGQNTALQAEIAALKAHLVASTARQGTITTPPTPPPPGGTP